MKHLKKFNEEIGDPRLIGMSEPDKNGRRFPIIDKNIKLPNLEKNRDKIYKKSDDYEMLELFVKELGLNVTEEQIINFLKDLSI